MVNEAAAAALGGWLWLALGHGRFWSLRGLIPPPSLPGARRVVAVIPARNEAATIRQTVESLVAQEGVSVIVVDDDSSEATAELASAAGATVVPAGPLPPGWTGKMWAVRRGVEAARSSSPDFLLLTDADIVHAPDSVARLLGTASRESRDLVSVMVRLNCESPAEKFLIPAFVFFFFMLYPPAWIRRSDRNTAGAAGGCVLIRPSALDRIGGIESIRGELIDDCALASEVKRTGGSVWLGLSDNIRSIRKYPEFADVRLMIARTAFTQLKYSPLLLTGTVAGMCFLYVLPVLAALDGSLYGLLAWAVMAAIYAPMVRLYRQPLLASALLPAAALLYTAATLESAVRYWTGQGGAWKGRHQAVRN